MEKLLDREVMSNFAESFGNDEDLGREYRNFVMAYCGPGGSNLTKFYPNDFDLGREVRKNSNKISK